MNRIVRTTAGTVSLLAAAGLCATALGRLAQQRRIAREIADLHGAVAGPNRGVVTDAELEPLPEPVRRWLRWAQVPGTTVPRTVRLTQEGTFRLREDQGWMPFTATQHYTTDPPAFVWSTTMQMMPLVSLSGRDRYTDGIGDMDMRLLSLIPVANTQGGRLNQGAMLRFLNETMWFPAAALQPYISWAARNDTSATATMSFGGETASAIFHFDPEGRITNMTAHRANDERNEILPWSTPITAYGEHHGVRMPVEGSGVWSYETGDFDYIRLRIVDIEYDAIV